jgi:ribosomal-protein-alanine N-acetyltransferase
MNHFDLPLLRPTVMGLRLELRLLSEPELASVMELERMAHAYPWRQSSFEDCLRGRQRCWLAYVEHNLVGYVVVTHAGGDAELLNLAVSPKFQRRGIGSVLVQHAIACVQGFADMLFLEVRVSNQKAINLYAQEGFFEVGHRKNYYPRANGHEDALLMASQL